MRAETAISTADRVEERRIDADRVQQQPVAEDLREDGHQHEADTRPLTPAPEHSEALPQFAPLAERQMPSGPRWPPRSLRRR